MPKKTSFIFGSLLLHEGLISEEQLEKALKLQQRHHPDRLIGNILADFFAIPKNDIEEIFLREVLMPMANSIFSSQVMEMAAQLPHTKRHVSWIMVKPLECTKHSCESMLLKNSPEGINLTCKLMRDRLILRVRLDIGLHDGESRPIYSKFTYDVREKQLTIKDSESAALKHEIEWLLNS